MASRAGLRRLDRSLELVIDGYCLSSCANYWSLASPDVTLRTASKAESFEQDAAGIRVHLAGGLRRHQTGRAAVEGERRGHHPAMTHRNEIGVTPRVLLLDQVDGDDLSSVGQIIEDHGDAAWIDDFSVASLNRRLVDARGEDHVHRIRLAVAGEEAVRRRDRQAPVAAPMDRHQHQVAGPALRQHGRGNASRRLRVELGQLFGAALFLYALAASPYRGWQSQVALMAPLPIMAASGAPSIAIALGVGGLLVCRQSSYEPVRRLMLWIAAALVLAAVAATVFGAWGWRLRGYERIGSIGSLLRQLLWFLWPAWPLALWTLWRWRKHLMHRHISVPLCGALVALLACVAMGGSDRALMLALPSLAVLAAFILPTLQRSTAAAIDWFSVFFFTICALFVWVMYVAMQTGWPAKPAANVAKLAVGFVPQFSGFALVLGLLNALLRPLLVG